MPGKYAQRLLFLQRRRAYQELTTLQQVDIAQQSSQNIQALRQSLANRKKINKTNGKSGDMLYTHLTTKEKALLKLIENNLTLITSVSSPTAIQASGHVLKSSRRQLLDGYNAKYIRTPNHQGRNDFVYFVAGIQPPRPPALQNRPSYELFLRKLLSETPNEYKEFYISPHITAFSFNVTTAPVILGSTEITIKLHEKTRTIEYIFKNIGTEKSRTISYHEKELIFHGMHICAGISYLLITLLEYVDNDYRTALLASIADPNIPEAIKLRRLSVTQAALLPSHLLAEAKCPIQTSLSARFAAFHTSNDSKWDRYSLDSTAHTGHRSAPLELTYQRIMEECVTQYKIHLSVLLDLLKNYCPPQNPLQITNKLHRKIHCLYLLKQLAEIFKQSENMEYYYFPVLLNRLLAYFFSHSEFSIHDIQALLDLEFIEPQYLQVRYKANFNETAYEDNISLVQSIISAKSCDVSMLKLLHEYGVDFQKNIMAHICRAVNAYQLDVLKFLLTFELTIESRYATEALFFCIKNFNTGTMLTLLLAAGFDPNCTDSNGETAFHKSLLTDNDAITALLYQYGGEIIDSYPMQEYYERIKPSPNAQSIVVGPNLSDDSSLQNDYAEISRNNSMLEQTASNASDLDSDTTYECTTFLRYNSMVEQAESELQTILPSDTEDSSIIMRHQSMFEFAHDYESHTKPSNMLDTPTDEHDSHSVIKHDSMFSDIENDIARVESDCQYSTAVSNFQRSIYELEPGTEPCSQGIDENERVKQTIGIMNKEIVDFYSTQTPGSLQHTQNNVVLIMVRGQYKQTKDQQQRQEPKRYYTIVGRRLDESKQLETYYGFPAGECCKTDATIFATATRELAEEANIRVNETGCSTQLLHSISQLSPEGQKQILHIVLFDVGTQLAATQVYDGDDLFDVHKMALPKNDMRLIEYNGLPIRLSNQLIIDAIHRSNTLSDTVKNQLDYLIPLENATYDTLLMAVAEKNIKYINMAKCIVIDTKNLEQWEALLFKTIFEFDLTVLKALVELYQHHNVDCKDILDSETISYLLLNGHDELAKFLLTETNYVSLDAEATTELVNLAEANDQQDILDFLQAIKIPSPYARA